MQIACPYSIKLVLYDEYHMTINKSSDMHTDRLLVAFQIASRKRYLNSFKSICIFLCMATWLHSMTHSNDDDTWVWRKLNNLRHRVINVVLRCLPRDDHQRTVVSHKSISTCAPTPVRVRAYVNFNSLVNEYMLRFFHAYMPLVLRVSWILLIQYTDVRSIFLACKHIRPLR